MYICIYTYIYIYDIYIYLYVYVYMYIMYIPVQIYIYSYISTSNFKFALVSKPVAFNHATGSFQCVRYHLPFFWAVYTPFCVMDVHMALLSIYI